MKSKSTTVILKIFYCVFETLPQIILFRHIHGALGLSEVPGVADMVAVDVGHEDAADDEGDGGTDADNRRIR